MYVYSSCVECGPILDPRVAKCSTRLHQQVEKVLVVRNRQNSGHVPVFGWSIFSCIDSRACGRYVQSLTLQIVRMDIGIPMIAAAPPSRSSHARRQKLSHEHYILS